MVVSGLSQLLVEHALDHRGVADAEAEQEAAARVVGQQALGHGGHAGQAVVDVGDAGGDDHALGGVEQHAAWVMASRPTASGTHSAP